MLRSRSLRRLTRALVAIAALQVGVLASTMAYAAPDDATNENLTAPRATGETPPVLDAEAPPNDVDDRLDESGGDAATRANTTSPPGNKEAADPAPDILLEPEAGAARSGGIADMVGPFIKSMLMLGVVIALAYLTLHKGLGKLMVRTQMGKRMKVVERVSLDQRRSLYLVEIDGREMVIGGGEGGVIHMVDLPSSGDVDDDADSDTASKSNASKSKASKFKHILGSRGKRDSGDDDGETANA